MSLSLSLELSLSLSISLRFFLSKSVSYFLSVFRSLFPCLSFSLSPTSGTEGQGQNDPLRANYSTLSVVLSLSFLSLSLSSNLSLTFSSSVCLSVFPHHPPPCLGKSLSSPLAYRKTQSLSADCFMTDARGTKRPLIPSSSRMKMFQQDRRERGGVGWGGGRLEIRHYTIHGHKKQVCC